MSDRYKLIVDVQLFLIDDGKILLKRRQNSGYHDGKYDLIAAGHLEPDEPASHALAREAMEEAGITIDPANLTCVHATHRKDVQDQRISFFYVATGFSGVPTIMEPEKCDDMQWFSLDKLPAVVPYMKHGLEMYQKGQFYSEYNWE